MVRRLLYLNGLAAIGVVLNHAVGWGFVAKFWWVHRYLPVTSPNFESLGDISYYAMRAIEQLIIVSIPIFLFVSGFFIAVSAGRNRKTVDWILVLNRIKNLLIPYVIWSGFVFLLEFMESRTLLPAGVYLSRLVFGRTYDVFYFVPLLVQLYLLSPFLVPLARNKPKLFLLGAGLLQLLVLIMRYGVILGTDSRLIDQLGFLLPSWFFPGFVFWFALGIVIGFRLQELKELQSKVDKRVLLTLLVGIFLAGMFEWEFLLQLSGQDWIASRHTLIDALYSGIFILAFISFDHINYPLASQIGGLGTKSFGIYLVHAPVLEYTARLIYHVLPILLAYQVLFLPVLITLGLGIPLLLMTAVKKSPAKFSYGYLFG
jgi:probable poly-beta-1,6-N-acetyl-D-glucosamine export protein